MRHTRDRLASQQQRGAAARHRTEVTGGDGVPFIHAGVGNGKSIPIPPGFHSDQITHIYGAVVKVEKEGSLYVIKGLPNQFKENTSHRFLCPEIEVASGSKTNGDAAARLWGGRQVRDGSLPDTGFEINLSPCQGDLYLRMVSEICDQLTRDKATVTKSCGLHVHVDGRDLDYMDIRKVVLLYELIEPALYACLPMARHTSHYSQPCGFTYAQHLRAGEPITFDAIIEDRRRKKKIDLKTAVVEMVYGKGVSQPSARTKYGEGEAHNVRYRGLNLYSWYYRRSLEFRHAPGSIDPEYINNWSLLCAGIVDTAKKISEKQVKGLWQAGTKELETSTEGLYAGIFRTGTLPLSFLESSTRLLKDICQPRCSDFITAYQEENVSGSLKARKKALFG